MIEKNRPLCVFLPKVTAYRKYFDDTKDVSFLIKNDQLLEKYNENWDKVSYTIGREIDSNPVYNKIYLRAKIKSNNGKTSTNFHNNKLPNEGSQLIFILAIPIDLISITGKKSLSPNIFRRM